MAWELLVLLAWIRTSMLLRAKYWSHCFETWHRHQGEKGIQRWETQFWHCPLSCEQHRYRNPCRHHLKFLSFLLSKCCPANRSATFCNTGSPLARTRWVRSKFSSCCPLSSNQRHRLTTASLIIFRLKKFWECWESNLELLVRSKYATSVLCSHPRSLTWGVKMRTSVSHVTRLLAKSSENSRSVIYRAKKKCYKLGFRSSLWKRWPLKAADSGVNRSKFLNHNFYIKHFFRPPSRTDDEGFLNFKKF